MRSTSAIPPCTDPAEHRSGRPVGPTRRRVLRTMAGSVGVAVVGGWVAACSDGGDAAQPGPGSDPSAAPVDPSDSTTGAGDLPVNDADALKAQFDPRFAPFGLTVTRIGLYDLDAGFVPDDEGTHLAIYVEPIDDSQWDLDRYVAAVAPSAAVSSPYSFEQWSGLTSFDICQEPPQAESPEPQPPVMTQVVFSRADSDGVDWDDATLADLLAATLRDPDSARVAGRPDVVATDAWQQAAIAAVELV